MVNTHAATLIRSIIRQISQSYLRQGSVNLKPVLKSLYCLIESNFSSDLSRDDVETSKLKFEEMTAICNMLFEELHQRFSFVEHKDRDFDGVALYAVSRDSLEELLLLLRCCVLIFRLCAHVHSSMQKPIGAVFLPCMLPLQCTQIEEGSFCFTKLASSLSTFSSCGSSSSKCAKSCDSCIFLLKRMLEVLLDEMTEDRQFRERIAMLYTFACAERNRSAFSSTHIESLLDVITAHFILSISGEQFLESFTHSLIWINKQRLCDLRLSAAISLIKYPLMCPPVLLRAHMISLVSEVIGICDSHDVPRTTRYMKDLSVCHDDSVTMYCEHMSKLLEESCDSPYKLRNLRRAVRLHFHSEIYDKVNFMLARCDSSWRANVGNMSTTKVKSSLENDAITYVKMNMSIFGESRKNEVFSFLSSLVTKVISSEVDEELYPKIKKWTMQELCLLASVLKLMSCSFLRATCLKKNDGTSPKCESLVGKLVCLVEYDLHVPVQVQELIDDTLNTCHTTQYDSKMIFMHFAGLLSLCKVTGLNFLMKGCLFATMVFLNTAFEEHSLEFLNPSSNSSCLGSDDAAPSTASAPSISHGEPFDGSGVERRHIRRVSSFKVASVFQRKRKRLSRDPEGDVEAETTNGEAYLKHIISNARVISELADYIVCKPEKNYRAWLRDRKEMVLRKVIKRARRQWQRIKAAKEACNYSVGKDVKRELHSRF